MKKSYSSMFDTQLEDVMKKLISLVIAAAISVSLFGCAEKKPVAPPANPPVEKTAPATDTPATPAPEGGAAPAPEGKAP